MSTTAYEPRNIFDALIAGLGVTRQSLNVKCEAALRALGGRSVHFLLEAAEASPRQRKRIKAFAATIDKDQDIGCDAKDLIPQALLLAAVVQNEQDNPALIPVLKRLGSKYVDILICEALSNCKNPSVCQRLLNVIKQLGGSRSLGIQTLVINLSVSDYAAVREVAYKLLCCMPTHTEATLHDQ